MKNDESNSYSNNYATRIRETKNEQRQTRNLRKNRQIKDL